MSELAEFERRMREDLNQYIEDQTPTSKPNKPEPTIKTKPGGSPPQGTVVILAVRQKRLQMDTHFTYTSSSISRLEAQLEAEKAAREAGCPIVGFLVDIYPL